MHLQFDLGKALKSALGGGLSGAAGMCIVISVANKSEAVKIN